MSKIIKNPYLLLSKEEQMQLVGYTVGQEGNDIVKRYADGSFEILETLEAIKNQDVILD